MILHLKGSTFFPSWASALGLWNSSERKRTLGRTWAATINRIHNNNILTAAFPPFLITFLFGWLVWMCYLNKQNLRSLGTDPKAGTEARGLFSKMNINLYKPAFYFLGEFIKSGYAFRRIKLRKRFSRGKENKLFLCAKNEITKILILRIFLEPHISLS